MTDTQMEKHREQIFQLKKQFLQYFERSTSRHFKVDSRKIEAYTQDFVECFPQRPVEKNIGGGGIVPNYWLYIMVRILQPPRIIESGVFRGQTSWLLRQAQPNADIHSFDINLKHLQYRDETICFYQQDWMEVDIRENGEGNGLIFFDDHINQAMRVRQAYDRGFKWLVFDDNVPPDLISRIGIPALPSIGMLFDEGLKEGDTISWKLNEKEYSYTFNESDTHNARELISEYFVFPTFTYLTLVRLK
jgi:hypothetical protein